MTGTRPVAKQKGLGSQYHRHTVQPASTGARRGEGSCEAYYRIRRGTPWQPAPETRHPRQCTKRPIPMRRVGVHEPGLSGKPEQTSALISRSQARQGARPTIEEASSCAPPFSQLRQSQEWCHITLRDIATEYVAMPFLWIIEQLHAGQTECHRTVFEVGVFPEGVQSR